MTTANTDQNRRRALTVLGIVVGALVLAFIALLAVSGLSTTTTNQAGSVEAGEVVLDLRAPGEVEIVATDGDQISIETYVRDPLGLADQDERLEQGTLVVESSCAALWLTFLNPCRVDYVLRVPAATEVSGSTNNARVELTGLVASIDLTNRNGAMTASDIEGSVRLETSNGAVVVSGARGEVVVATNNGAVTLRDLIAIGTIEATTDNGAIEVSNTIGDLDLRTANGRIEIVDVDATTVDAETANSSITMTMATSPEHVVAETRNGAIEILLPTDAPAYAVDAATSNGSTDIADLVVDPDARYTLDLRTGNGNITVSRR